MVEIKTQFNINSLALKGRYERALPAAKSAVLHQMLEDTEPYIPYKTGRLTENGGVDLENDSIVYDLPYAKFAFNPKYRGRDKVYDTSGHPLAQGNPYKASTQEFKDEWVRLFKKKLVEEMNNDNR